MLLQGQYDQYEFDTEKDLFKEGGKFSVLYRGRALQSSFPVLIKTLSSGLMQDEAAYDALRYESTFRFEHPRLLKLIDFAEWQGIPFLISREERGLDLKTVQQKRLLKRGDWRTAIGLALQVLEGLEHMHGSDAYHRDLKPSNILLHLERAKEITHTDVKVLDYGMAIWGKDLQRRYDTHIKPFSLVYATPEQVLNFHSLTKPSTDLYALGIILYEVITGQPPLYDEHPLKLMTLQLTYDIPKHRSIPSPLMEILQKMTAKHLFRMPPSKYDDSELRELLQEGQLGRYQNASALRGDLQELLNIPMKKRGFRWPWK